MGQVSSFMKVGSGDPPRRGGVGSRRPTLQLLLMLCMVGAAVFSAYAMPIGLRIAMMGRAAERQPSAQLPQAPVELLDAFAGLPVAIESDGDDGWKVTIMNDIDSAKLPLEIPDKLGNVTIDLNGHDLKGEDGKSAIVIVPGGGGGTPTQLAIVTTGGDAVVKGGSGADAIEIADGANAGVKADVGAGGAEVSG